MENITQEYTDNELVVMTRWAETRAIRDIKLKSADILLEKTIDKGESETACRQYRQALRDIPQTFSDAQDVVWPTKPQLSQS